jgi:UMF1 family MFS transporter
MQQKKKTIWGWAMYDWANSAFATTIMAGFFPVFFKQYWSIGTDVNTSTALLGLGNALASLIVAMMAPVLGAIADKATAKKGFLLVFAYMGVLATAALFVVSRGQWHLAIIVYLVGVIGFSGSNIFYDALLPDVAGDRVDFVSSLGFSMGYLGGGLLFLINVIMTLFPERFGLADAGMAVRVSFLSVACWWGGFSFFTIIWVPSGPREDRPPWSQILIDGWHQFIATLRRVKRYKTAVLFLLAYWFYIDGVDTIIKMAVDYGISLGFDSNDLIKALLITQFVGFPAALGFGKLGQIWGVKRSIYLAIVVYIGVTFWGAMMDNKAEFYILAIIVGLVQGGVQALSRSFYTRLIPEGHAAEFFGFYNMLGKFATILGPALMGIVGLVVRHMLMPDAPTPEEIVAVGNLASRLSITSIVLLFIIGLILLAFVDEEKGRREAGRG